MVKHNSTCNAIVKELTARFHFCLFFKFLFESADIINNGHKFKLDFASFDSISGFKN